LQVFYVLDFSSCFKTNVCAMSASDAEAEDEGLRSILLAVFSVGLVASLAFAVITPKRISVGALCRKVELCFFGVAYHLLSCDGQFKLPPDPGRARATSPAKKKRIIFVRHGESIWNEVFNRGFGASFPLRLLIALAHEVSLLFSLDSLFFDSPLSDDGIAQAQTLGNAVKASQTPETEDLKRACENAVFVTSCLRRAAATALLGFSPHLTGGRPLWVLSCLQEISRNVDTLAFAGPRQPPLIPASTFASSAATSAQPPGMHPPSSVPAAAPGISGLSPTAAPAAGHGCLQAAFNFGNKGLTTLGQQRLEEFCEWVFAESGPATLLPTVIVTGHSLWFRTFFQAYLPHTSSHESKHAKIVNCGVVAFDLELLEDEHGGPSEYRIVQDSILVMHGGFEAKRSKRSKSL